MNNLIYRSTVWHINKTNAENEPLAYEIVESTVIPSVIPSVIPCSPEREAYINKLNKSQREEKENQDIQEINYSLWDGIALCTIALAFSILSIAMYIAK